MMEPIRSQLQEAAVAQQVWLRGQWYPACASSRLRRSPLATQVLDEELVVFRGPHGNATALENRCPHRGVELSLGRVSAGTLACRYHGWRYDVSGRCIEIPSLTHGRIPAACRVRRFECIEQDGYVWVWVDDASPASAPPTIQGFSSRGWVQGSMTMRCSWLAGVENTLDWCHPAFAHRWTHPQFYETLLRGSRVTSYEVRTGEAGGLVVFSPSTASEDDPVPEKPAVLLTFQLPNRVIVKIARGQFAIIVQFVPTGEDTCRMEWMRGSFVGRGLRWSPRKGRINLQDRTVLESTQRCRRDGEISVTADASSLLARRIVELAVAGHWPQQRGALPRRRVVAVRV
jgi:phenylpropionate dioxygenase-like ring-hydroxylating dioxygenase large terminal subunit